jgi:hypothetical protein
VSRVPLRSFTGEHDRAFVDARLAEIRRPTPEYQ